LANYDNNFNDELRQRLSIVDVVGRHIPLVKKGQNYWGCCPFHNEKTPSFSVNEQKGFYHCFGCGEHGDIISFIMKSQNMGYIDAIKELATLAGLKLPDYKPKSPEQQAREISYFEIMELAAKTFSEKLYDEYGRAALEYIRRRGFTDEVIKKYRIGYAPKNNLLSAKLGNQKETNVIATGLVRRGDYGLHDFFRDRLMFPIFNIHGQIVAFSGRSMDGSEPKYINTSDTELFHKRQTIFGLNFARDPIYKANRSIVVEGQIDAIQMQTHGFAETIAPLGTALTEDHLQILCKSNRNITFCFDGDTAGQKAAARAAGLIMPFLRDNSDVRFAFVTGGKDPDDILKKTDGTAQMKNIIDSAISLEHFLWEITINKFPGKDPNIGTQAKKFINNELEKINDFVLKTMWKKVFENKIWLRWEKRPNKQELSEIEKDKKRQVAKKLVLPEVDNLTKNALHEIATKYPELIEKHSEFLLKIGANFDDTKNAVCALNKDDAEKFIVSMKLINYITNLQTDRAAATKEMTSESMNRVKAIDSEITSATEKLNKLSEV
jgi:DNA primase